MLGRSAAQDAARWPHQTLQAYPRASTDLVQITESELFPELHDGERLSMPLDAAARFAQRMTAERMRK